LQFAQTWPNCWQFLDCVRPFSAPYASTLIATWQGLGSRKISWDFDVLGKVIRKRGRFKVFDTSGGDRRMVVIYLALITTKLRLTSPSNVSSAGVVCGRWLSPLHVVFRFGVERVIVRLLVSKWDLTDWKSAMPLVMTLILFLLLRNSKGIFDHTLQLLLQLKQVSGRR
jgi:hypothetical protein